MRIAPFVLAGEVDMANADRLRDQLLEYVNDSPDPPDVLIDCTGLTFIDSSGLRVLLDLATQTSRRLVLKGLPDSCRRVFELTRLDDVFTIE